MNLGLQQVWKHVTQKPPLGAQINWESGWARGLVLDCLFNEGAGAGVYDAGSRVIGLNSGTQWIGNGLLFTDSANYVRLTGWRFPTDTDRTILLACELTTAGGGGFGRLIGSSTDTMQVYMQADGSLYHRWAGGSVTAAGFYSYGQRLALVFVLRGTGAAHTCDIYRNGIWFSQNIGTGLAETGDTYFGNRGTTTNRGVDGSISHVRGWHRAFSAAEVAELYAQPYGGDLYLVPGPRIYAIPLLLAPQPTFDGTIQPAGVM